MEMESKASMNVCPGCTSMLIYPVAIDRHPDGRRIVIERYCPECEHNDSVCCGVAAAERWVRHERRIRLQLVRRVVELELDDILGVPALG
jgi:hypothetical protein